MTAADAYRTAMAARDAEVAATMTERVLQQRVTDLARYTGWLVYHPYDSRRSNPGWPDLALVKPPRLLLVELKTARGRIRPDQQTWLDALRGCTGVEVHLWRPADWIAETIQQELQR